MKVQCYECGGFFHFDDSDDKVPCDSEICEACEDLLFGDDDDDDAVEAWSRVMLPVNDRP